MNSLRRRLVLSIGGSALCIIATACAVVWYIYSEQLHQEYDKDIAQASEHNDRRFIFDYFWELRWKRDNPDEERPRREVGRYHFILFDGAEKTAIHHSEHLDQARVEQFIAQFTDTWSYHSLGEGQTARVYTRKLDRDRNTRSNGSRGRRGPSLAELPEELYFMTIAPLDEIQNQEKNTALAFLLVTIISAILCGIAAAWISAKAVKPMHMLSQDIAGIDAHQLDQRIGMDKMPKELHPIIQALNASLENLANSFAREKQLTADLAHELRTPLAAVRMELEQLLHQSLDTDAHQALENAFTACQQMQSLAERILLMARLESGLQDTEATSIDVADEINERFARIPQAQLQLENKIPLSACLVCDQTLFRMVIDNLMNNANEYAPAKSTLSINAEQGSDYIQITISNAISPDDHIDCTAMFTPYWRADSARSRTGSHAGLGLPLVQRMMACMGASVWASIDDDSQRFHMHLRWPNDDNAAVPS